jgi:hypothetical protein
MEILSINLTQFSLHSYFILSIFSQMFVCNPTNEFNIASDSDSHAKLLFVSHRTRCSLNIVTVLGEMYRENVNLKGSGLDRTGNLHAHWCVIIFSKAIFLPLDDCQLLNGDKCNDFISCMGRQCSSHLFPFQELVAFRSIKCGLNWGCDISQSLKELYILWFWYGNSKMALFFILLFEWDNNFVVFCRVNFTLVLFSSYLFPSTSLIFPFLKEFCRIFALS